MSIRSDRPGYVLVKDRIPYSGKGFDELLATLRLHLSNPINKYTQKIVLEVGEPYILLEKMVPEEEAKDVTKFTVEEVIRTQKMEEYVPEKEQPGINHLWDIFANIHREGLEVGFVAVGSKIDFQKWLGVRIPTANLNVFGVPLKIIDIPDYVFVVCGTTNKTAEPEDIKYCIKGVIA